MQSGRRGPDRQASPPPARHRPGARTARRMRCLLLLMQTEGDFTMARRKPNRLCAEPLEDRRLLSANVVVEWNQRALQSIGQARVSPGRCIPRAGDHAGGRLRRGRCHRPVARAVLRRSAGLAQRLLVLGDGAARVRGWFEGLAIPLGAMIVCWWQLRKRRLASGWRTPRSRAARAGPEERSSQRPAHQPRSSSAFVHEEMQNEETGPRRSLDAGVSSCARISID
jgi:hypothetical protein